MQFLLNNKRMHVIRAINKSAKGYYPSVGTYSSRKIEGRKTRLEMEIGLLSGQNRSMIEERLGENLLDFQKDSRAAFSRKDRVLSRLRQENQELMNKMKKMNSEIDLKMNHIKHRRSSPMKPEMLEVCAQEEIDNMDTQIMLLEKDLEWLRKKERKEVSSAKQIQLQSIIMQRQKECDEIRTTLRNKTRNIKETEKKIQFLESNRDKEQAQREEEKLAKLIHAEQNKAASLQLQSEQQVKAAELRKQKITALQVQIRIQLQQIESLKNEHKSITETAKNIETSPESNKEELVQLLAELKSCFEQEYKEQIQNRTTLEAEVQSSQQQLKLLLYENRKNSHKLQEMSRIISMGKRKSRSKSPLPVRREQSIQKLKRIEKYVKIKFKSKTPRLIQQDSTDKPAGSTEAGEEHSPNKDQYLEDEAITTN